VQDLCVPGYTKKVRNVPAEMKREVYEEYGITSHESGDYEVDHLIPLELGGSNSIKNLWPESDSKEGGRTF
jgi:5-methylcytosine-specific restriction endonuclease McrA